MVIAAGALMNIRKGETYCKTVEKCKQIIEEKGEELSEETKSLESKVRRWGNLQGISGILFMSSLVGAPLFERGLELMFEALNYEQLIGDKYTFGLPTLAYIFGSMTAFCVGGFGKDYYADTYLTELKKQANYGNIE